MILIDFIFLGWYKILEKTIYEYKTVNDGIGPREHSFVISFFLHGINVWSILSVLLIEYPKDMSSLYVGLLSVIVVFIIGYYIYYKRKRADKVISSQMNAFRVTLSLVLAVGYAIVTVYLMFEVGNYVRSILYPESVNQ